MESIDRRWFFPQVTETAWRREDFDTFFQWLTSGGLSIVAQWAEEYGDYVKTGELPPMTKRKQVMIEESEAEELRWVREYCAGRIIDSDSFVISTAVAFAFAKERISKNLFSKKRAFGLAMEKSGMMQVTKTDGSEFTLKYQSEQHRLLMSPQAQSQLQTKPLDGEELKVWFRLKLGETQAELKASVPI